MRTLKPTSISSHKVAWSNRDNKSQKLSTSTGQTGAAGGANLRQNGGQWEKFRCQVGKVNQQEDKERLNDADLFGETSDEAKEDSKDETNQSPPDTDDEEGGCGGGGGGVKSVRVSPCGSTKFGADPETSELNVDNQSWWEPSAVAPVDLPTPLK